MNWEYSPRERFDKIVEILAEGTLSLIKKRAQVTAQFVSEAFEYLFPRISKMKSKDSYSFTSAVVNGVPVKGPVSPHLEPSAKIQIRTIEIRQG